MIKKYQVFISSTYKDLVEERKEIYNALLDTDCIPAGMENFSAADEEQFSVIKKVIDLCDYYILIIGGKYGSVNARTKKSYTEMEYEYAISKGIPVLVFPISDINLLPENKRETEIERIKMLEEFTNRAKSNRLCSMWDDINDLKYKVAISIGKAKETYNRLGWIRGEEKAVINFRKGELKGIFNLLNSTKIKIKFTAVYRDNNANKEYKYSDIFKKIAPVMITKVNIEDFKYAINKLYGGDGAFVCYSETHNEIKAFLFSLELIECESEKIDKGLVENISLTNKGRELLKYISNLDSFDDIVPFE